MYFLLMIASETDQPMSAGVKVAIFGFIVLVLFLSVASATRINKGVDERVERSQKVGLRVKKARDAKMPNIQSIEDSYAMGDLEVVEKRLKKAGF